MWMLRIAQHDKLKTCRVTLRVAEHVHSAMLPQALHPLPMPYRSDCIPHNFGHWLLNLERWR